MYACGTSGGRPLQNLNSNKGEDILKKNRKYVRIGIVCAIIIALVLTVPFPSYINFSGPGFRMYNDISEEPITLMIKGWHWQSIAGFNRMTGAKLEIIYPVGESTIFGFPFSSWALFKFKDLYWASLHRYDSKRNSVEFATIYFNKRLDTFLISYYENKKWYFDLASADIGKSGEDILNFFRWYIWFDFDVPVPPSPEPPTQDLDF